MARPKSNAEPHAARAVVYMTDKDAADLRTLAKQNDRTISKELSRALRSHLASENKTRDDRP